MSKKKKIKRNFSKTVYSDKPIVVEIKKLNIKDVVRGKKKEKIYAAEATLLLKNLMLQGIPDSMSEMGEMESLRLQMAMDRMSKLMETLSNILKKMSETASEITQNLK